MSFKIKYTEEAIAELNKAHLWYQSKDIELGQRFKESFNKIRTELKENPEIFKTLETNYRRAVLGSSFPYTIHYTIDKASKTIKIFGVFHQSKNIEVIEQQTRLRKVHELKREKEIELKKRLEQLKQNDLEKDQGLDLEQGL